MNKLFKVGKVEVTGGETAEEATDRWFVTCKECGKFYFTDLPKGGPSTVKCHGCGSGNVKMVLVRDIEWIEGDGIEEVVNIENDETA